MSCSRAQAVLDAYGAAIGAYADAGREALAGDAAWLLMAEASEILVAKGKKVLRLEPQAGKETVLAAVLGRSGTLRAPTLRLGKRFLVGWSEALYREYLAAEQQQ